MALYKWLAFSPTTVELCSAAELMPPLYLLLLLLPFVLLDPLELCECKNGGVMTGDW
jgi:hypothetical protein